MGKGKGENAVIRGITYYSKDYGRLPGRIKPHLGAFCLVFKSSGEAFLNRPTAVMQGKPFAAEFRRIFSVWVLFSRE